jgi:hypothetical protein
VVLDWEKCGAVGPASEAMPANYEKSLSGEVTEMRASGRTGWCWTGKRRCSGPGERSDAGELREVTVGRSDRDACQWQDGVVLDWEKAVQQARRAKRCRRQMPRKEILRAPRIFLR